MKEHRHRIPSKVFVDPNSLPLYKMIRKTFYFVKAILNTIRTFLSYSLKLGLHGEENVKDLYVHLKYNKYVITCIIILKLFLI